MNAFKLKITSVCFLLIVASCDILQNRQPQQSLPFDSAYETLADLEAALIGAYSDLQNGSLAAADWIITSEIISDNGDWVGSFEEYTQVGAHDMVPSNGIMTGWWNQSYEVINDANIILEELPNVDGISDADANRIQGEALFLRGIAYFEMIKVFAIPWTVGDPASNPGVPIILQSVRGAQGFTSPERASVQAVYDQVIADLEVSQSLLPSANADGRATSFTATGYLMRVALQQQRYQDAADLAALVLNQVPGTFSLQNDPVSFFVDEFGPESIFEISNTDQDNPGVNGSLPTFFNEDGRDDVLLTAGFIAALDAIVPPDQEAALPAGWEIFDLRRTELTTDSDSETAGHQIATSSNTIKYEDAVNGSDNAPILRLPEFMLSRAEALAELSATLVTVPAEVYELLNEIRVRSLRVRNDGGGLEDPEPFVAYDITDFADKQELLDAIRLERRVELAFEGQRYHDLNRWGLDVAGDAPGADELIFPIPQREIDANPNITQNPGY